MPNTNPHTGVRYGVISFNALKDWCNEDLFYGNQARDLSYEGALAELKAEGKAKHVDYLEQAEESWKACGDETRLEHYEERWFEFKNLHYDQEDFVSDYVERNAENIQIDEPIIEGELDGVQYRISWLGGAPLLWVFEGPVGVAEQLCSPCAPGAADLDSGFVLEDEATANQKETGYTCHVVPKEWLRDA